MKTHVPARRLAAGALLGAMAVLAATAASAQCIEPRGDLTGDGMTNIVDVQCGIYVSLNGIDNITSPPACLGYAYQAADSNCDGEIDVTDLIIVVQHAVLITLDPGIDADGDACPDACEVPATFDGAFSFGYGTSEGSAFRLSAVGNGFEASGSSGNSMFQLRPRAVGMKLAE
jgi:hypothetical protein